MHTHTHTRASVRACAHQGMFSHSCVLLLTGTGWCDKAICETCLGCLQALEKAVQSDMKSVSEYFGELHEVSDPVKVLRVIRNFMPVFEKGVDDLKVCDTSLTMLACSGVLKSGAGHTAYLPQ